MHWRDSYPCLLPLAFPPVRDASFHDDCVCVRAASVAGRVRCGGERWNWLLAGAFRQLFCWAGVLVMDATGGLFCHPFFPVQHRYPAWKVLVVYSLLSLTFASFPH